MGHTKNLGRLPLKAHVAVWRKLVSNSPLETLVAISEWDTERRRVPELSWGKEIRMRMLMDEGEIEKWEIKGKDASTLGLFSRLLFKTLYQRVEYLVMFAPTPLENNNILFSNIEKPCSLWWTATIILLNLYVHIGCWSLMRITRTIWLAFSPLHDWSGIKSSTLALNPGQNILRASCERHECHFFQFSQQILFSFCSNINGCSWI